MVKDDKFFIKSVLENLGVQPDGGLIEEISNAERAQKAALIASKTSKLESEVAKAVAASANLECFDDFSQMSKPSKNLSVKLVSEYSCLPVSETEDTFVLASPWIPNDEINKWIFSISGKFAEWRISPATALSEKIAEYFGVGAGSLSEKDMAEFAAEADGEIEEDENAAIIKFVNEIITRAMADRATDIHIEPQRDSLNIRYRIDGNLVPVRVPDNLLRFKDSIISRIKIMARLNISEKRRPQDGRIGFTLKTGEDIDIRISSLPTMYGESVSMRLLTKKSQPISIADLGFLPDDAEKIKRPLARPHGIILVTGPTGSGKSTTLTAFIRRLRSPEIRIITVEDPVEYEVEGVNQTQVHPEIGLTFSSVLRSVLRQDPDVIMVGEIRDRETADIAIRASLTGHLVLSTLHT
ncbi:MAG: type II/IV secretion system protein, partial [Opitutales bacterium]|nr:type II/IV secretion system protein [Opitutales bacterium]